MPSLFCFLKYLTTAALLLISSMIAAQSNTYTNTIGMEFILIQPGKMIVGKFEPPYLKPNDTIKSNNDQDSLIMWVSPEDRGYNKTEFKLAEQLAIQDASPGFIVAIEKPYYIGKFEVTQAQWKKIMGYNPSVFKNEKVENSDQHPVENITWKDAQSFIRKLNALDKGKIYRLPTEFEWEYAARAGASEDIPWSEIQQTAQLGTRSTQPVGKKKPNVWGLYDMLGNTWEWVADYYNEKIFADPIPPKKGKEHVLKGASFVGDVKNTTYFTHAAGPGNGWDVGFRIVMEVPK